MTQEIKTFFSENTTYISLGLLFIIVSIAIFIGSMNERISNQDRLIERNNNDRKEEIFILKSDLLQFKGDVNENFKEFNKKLNTIYVVIIKLAEKNNIKTDIQDNLFSFSL